MPQFPKEVSSFGLPEFSKHVFPSGVAFIQSDAFRTKLHLGAEYASYIILSRPKTWFYQKYLMSFYDN